MQDLRNCCTTVAALISIFVTGRYAVVGCKLKQNANEGYNSCASLAGLVLCFIACFILLVIALLTTGLRRQRVNDDSSGDDERRFRELITD